MDGTVVGGNLTAMRSLTGTRWFPSTRGAIVALEALNPDYTEALVGFHHLRQAGVFEGAAGLLLGQFTEVEKQHGPDAVPALVREIVPNIPIATTAHFGRPSPSRGRAAQPQLTDFGDATLGS